MNQRNYSTSWLEKLQKTVSVEGAKLQKTVSVEGAKLQKTVSVEGERLQKSIISNPESVNKIRDGMVGLATGDVLSSVSNLHDGITKINRDYQRKNDS